LCLRSMCLRIRPNTLQAANEPNAISLPDTIG
jgi:hypothetical protein